MFSPYVSTLLSFKSETHLENEKYEYRLRYVTF